MRTARAGLCGGHAQPVCHIRAPVGHDGRGTVGHNQSHRACKTISDHTGTPMPVNLLDFGAALIDDKDRRLVGRGYAGARPHKLAGHGSSATVGAGIGHTAVNV